MELILLNLVLAIISSFIAIYIALTRSYRRARIVMVLILASSIWSYGYAMELYFTDISVKLFWAKIQVIGMALVVVWPMLVAHLTEKERYTGVRGVLLFAFPSVLMGILVATNEFHGLIFNSVSLNYLDFNLPLIKVYGFGYFLYLFYGYTIIFVSLAYGIISLKKSKNICKPRLFLVAVLVLMPVLSSVYFHFLANTQYIDYTSTINSIISIGILLLAPSELRIGDILPIEYSKILREMKDPVIILDKNDIIIHSNPAARRIINTEFKIPKNDIEGRNISDLSRRVELIGHADNPTEVLFNGHCYDLSSFSLNNWRGSLATRCLVFRDVTERKELEKKLRILHYYASNISKTESFLDVGLITENALKNSLGFPDGVLILKSGDCYELVQAWGMAKDNLSDRHINKLSKVEVLTKCCVEDFFSQLECIEKEVCNGLALLCVPIIDNKNHRGVICIFREQGFIFNEYHSRLLEIFGNHISSAVHGIENEQAIRVVQKEEIRRILEGAGRVSNIVRHDLRSPLQTIKNAAYILQKDPSNEKMIGIINESIEYMVKIIEDLVYTENVSNLDLQYLNLNTLIKQSLSHVLKPSNVKIVENLSQHTLMGSFDKIKIQRMLDNLFKNAIEAMPQGGTLSITSNVTDKMIQIQIRDTGIGIVDTDKLFMPFHTTKLNGMGLGLISVKQTIEAHKGTVMVESKPNVGTCFTLTFPSGVPHTGNSTTILSAMTST